MRRSEFEWIDMAVKILLVVFAIGAMAGILVAVHFIRKFW